MLAAAATFGIVRFPRAGALTCLTSCRCRLRKNRNRVPPVRWYADTALAVGLRIAPPERLRFFIAGDVPQVIVDFEVRTRTAGQGSGLGSAAHGASLCSSNHPEGARSMRGQASQEHTLAPRPAATPLAAQHSQTEDSS